MSRTTPKREKNAFSERKYKEYLRDVPKAAAVVAKCNPWVLAKLVRNSLPECADRSYEKIRQDQAQVARELESYTFVLSDLSERALREGHTQKAAHDKDGEIYFRKALEEERQFSIRDLGVLQKRKDGKGGLLASLSALYLAFLQKHIIVKTKREVSFTEMADILAAFLHGFAKLSDDDVIEPDALRKKLLRFYRRNHKRNPAIMKCIERMTACDSSRQNELDRLLGKTAPQ